MSRKDENFGADIATHKDYVTYRFEKFAGVPSTVVRSRLNNRNEPVRIGVQKNAPDFLQARTWDMAKEKNDRIQKSTAKYKIMKSGFEFASPDDKEMWEIRMKLAFYEMQIVRFEDKLEKMPAKDVLQRRHIEQTIRGFKAEWEHLAGVAK